MNQTQVPNVHFLLAKNQVAFDFSGFTIDRNFYATGQLLSISSPSALSALSGPDYDNVCVMSELGCFFSSVLYLRSLVNLSCFDELQFFRIEIDLSISSGIIRVCSGPGNFDPTGQCRSGLLYQLYGMKSF